ncbi:MAG: 5-formyltetrahydrofolate cyclo-ligase [Pseudanabaenaceae cyanobacterium]
MGKEQLNDREAQRRHYKQQRQQLSGEIWQRKSQLICENLAQWAVWQEARLILGFISHRQEPDLMPLIKAFPNKTWAMPRCQGDDLLFHHFTPATPLTPNQWGILEPPVTAPVLIPDGRTLCLVPGLAFDRQGNRLGSGRGYYDRLLCRHLYCVKVGVTFQEFVVPLLSSKSWDIKMDYLAHDGAIEPVQK